MRDAVIEGVVRVPRGYRVLGRVRSRSRPGLWHNVEVTVEWINGEVVLRGRCDCEAFVKGHMPCRHIIHLANVFIRNKGRLALLN